MAAFSIAATRVNSEFSLKQKTIKKHFFDGFLYSINGVKREDYSISETLIVFTIPLSLIGIAARLIK